MKIALSPDSLSPHGHYVVVCALAAFFLMIATHVDADALLTNTDIDSSKLVALTNADRLAHGASVLKEDTLLDTAAQNKANDMATRGYFSHFGPDGRAPWHWFMSAGYFYTRAGENLAVHFESAEDVETAWMHSPSHRDNILNTTYTTVGIGVAHGMYQGTSTTFIVQFFATPAKISKKNTPRVKARAAGALAIKN